MSEVVKTDLVKTDLVKTKDTTAETPLAEEEEHDTPDVVESVIPDPNWGWVGESPRVFQIAGVVVAVMLLLMIIGNHTGRTEDLFLVGFAALILLTIAKDWVLNKMSMRG